MTESQPYLDIIIFAMLAVFLGLRLRSVLGRRNSDQEPPRPMNNGAGSVIDLEPNRTPRAEIAAGDPLSRIAAADPAFTPEQFLKGAEWAFDMIVKAFAAGDKSALRPLLSDGVFADFSQAIDQHPETTELLRIVSATIDEARLDGRRAEIAVRFVSEQKTAHGEEIRMIDLWRFSREVSSKDPNWRVVATGSADQ